MASDNKELNIGIKVTSDTAGAKQATAAIDGVDKAVADLAKTEKEATNINGMYLDSLGRIHDESGKFVKVSAEERAGLKERIKIQQQDTVTTTGAVAAKKELGKANSNAAMGVMALSNAFQDAQYGMAGMINNIPGIVTGMGLGMGIAGAAQAAAVGVQILTKNFDLFGTELKAASKEATEAANEATALANSTQRAADAAADAAKKYAELNAALKKTEADYKAVSTASDEAIESAKRLQDIETKRGDLQSELAMAEIDAMAAGGQISKDDAASRREGVRAQRAARAAALEEKAMTAAVKAEEDRAAAAEAAAKAQKRILETKLTEEAAAGMMTKKDRGIAQQKLDALEKEAIAATKRAEELQSGYERETSRSVMTSVGGYAPSFEDTPAGKRAVQEIKQTRETAQSKFNQAQAVRIALSRDAAAGQRTGITTGLEDFNALRGTTSEQLAAFQRQAAESRRRAGMAGQDLGLARETTAVRARISAMTQASAAAASAQSGYGIGFTGPIPPQGFAIDQKESEKAAREADKEAKELARETVKIVRSLAAGLKFSKEEIAGLAAMVDDLRTSK